MTERKVYSIYLAGELFDAKDLAGNVLLAEAIEKQSQGKFRVVLPQDLELPSMEPKTIRDQDFEALLKCDAAVFQFDGGDPDSGTVVEFMAAKFADLPSVVMRTDFRRGGDRGENPWNLMCSYYPRTKVVVVDAMAMYASFRDGGVGPGFQRVEQLMVAVGQKIVENFDCCLEKAPLEGLPKEERQLWLRKSLRLD